MSSGFAPEPDDNVPILVPLQEEPLPLPDAVAAYEASIQNSGSPADLVVTEAPPAPVGRGWAFDFTKGRFLVSENSHGPLATNGLATLRLLIEKAMRTARGAHPLYDDSYGIDLPADLLGGPISAFPTDLYAARVREAARSAHERVVDVIDVRTSFDPDNEFIAASFTVLLDSGDTLTLQDIPLGA